MVDAYLDQATKHKYTITEPRDLNGPFTNLIYISPSEKTDRTLASLVNRYTNNPGLTKFSPGLTVLPFSKDIVYQVIDEIKDTAYKIVDLL